MENELEMRELEVMPKQESTIGENTPVKIGLVVGAFGLIVGAVATWCWWAATVSTKLDQISKEISASSVAVTAVQHDVAALQAWQQLIDKQGSPHVQSIESKLMELQKDFDIHKATSKP